jgi:phenylacetate-CoA ligase
MQEQMRKILAEKNLEYVKFCVRFVKEILPDKKTGKKKLLIN